MDTDIWAYGYAIIVALGGVIGYVKAGSVTSLVAGLAFGGLALIGAYQTSQDPHNYYLSLAVSGLLAGLMGYRFANSSKIMPAGLVAVLSIAMCCRILCRAFSPPGSPAAAAPPVAKQ
ncbi:transmembrane protein 14C [Dermacentor albipictus]|uniref:transmembrane protein 14C n=1 Tax=Dermacentor albipictus TaxID=60249 RepID=UPI0031FCA1E0